MCSTMCACACLNFFIVSPPAGVLIYIVLFKVKGTEAGGLTYLTMITAFQCCDLGGAVVFMRWVQYEAKKEMDARDGKTEERDVEQASEVATDLFPMMKRVSTLTFHCVAEKVCVY